MQAPRQQRATDTAPSRVAFCFPGYMAANSPLPSHAPEDSPHGTMPDAGIPTGPPGQPDHLKESKASARLASFMVVSTAFVVDHHQHSFRTALEQLQPSGLRLDKGTS